MFRFYEEVRVASPLPHNAEHAAQIGVMIGLGDEPGRPLSYGVFLYCTQRVVCFAEEELASTGRQFTREEFFHADLPPR